MTTKLLLSGSGQPAQAQPGGEDVRPNRYAGPCGRCGARVQKGAGTWGRNTGSLHVTEDDCEKTTKTWRSFEAGRLMEQHRAEKAAAYETAGLTVYWPHRIEYPVEITGHGIRALVGGYRPGEVFARGVEVYRGSELVYEGPRPKAETGDWYADRIAEDRATIECILSFAPDAQPEAEAGA